MKGNHHNGSEIPPAAGHRSKGKGGGGICICPECGNSVAHKAGVPCNSVLCTDCNVLMQRSNIPDAETSSAMDQEQIQLSGKSGLKILFPVIDSEKCTACGACIDICPASTIVLRDGKAFVIRDFCRNCRICIRVCRFNAFKLA